MSVQLNADQGLLEWGRRLLAEHYRFVTPTPLTHQRVLQRLATPLVEADAPSAGEDADRGHD